MFTRFAIPLIAFSLIASTTARAADGPKLLPKSDERRFLIDDQVMLIGKDMTGWKYKDQKKSLWKLVSDVKLDAANEKFISVKLNGKEIHKDVEAPKPTGSEISSKEVPTGPIMLQGDHGPVAFRNLRIKETK